MEYPNKYNISEQYASQINPDTEYQTEGEQALEVWHIFLAITDYVCNKIVEGVATWDDYAEVKSLREHAREEIRRLSIND